MSHESIQIHLNSKFAKTFNNLYYSDVNFETNLIQVDDNYSIHLSVINASIPYSFYNINTTNNKLTFHEYISETSRGLTLYIEEGNYTAYQLATYLSQNLPNTTVSYNSITNKFTFTNSVNDFIIFNEYSTCQNLLGLSTNDLYNGSVGRSLTLRFQINLAQYQMIKIATNFNAGSISNLNNNDMRILCSFPVNNAPYSLITYTNSDNYKIDLNKNCKWIYDIIDKNSTVSHKRFLEEKPYTYDDLKSVGKDSIKVTKVRNKDFEYEIESTNLGSYELFINDEQNYLEESD
jgi:hypothetical protein